MIFKDSEPSRDFMTMVGRALAGKLTGDEHERFVRLLKDHPELRSEFDDLAADMEHEKADEIQERGLRVLLGRPQPGDQKFLKSVKESDPGALDEFLENAFVLRVMAKSSSCSPSHKVPVSGRLTPEAQAKLLAAVDENRRYRKERNIRQAIGQQKSG